MAMAIVYEGIGGVEVSSDEVLQELKLVEGRPERHCVVCGDGATKELGIELILTDMHQSEYHPLAMPKFEVCDDHAHVKLQFRLMPITECLVTGQCLVDEEDE